MTVTVYGTTTCPFCKMEKAWLTEKAVMFKDIVVDEEPGAAEALLARSGQLSVPVTIVERDGKEEIVVGFDKTRLASLLGIAA